MDEADKNNQIQVNISEKKWKVMKQKNYVNEVFIYLKMDKSTLASEVPEMGGISTERKATTHGQ